MLKILDILITQPIKKFLVFVYFILPIRDLGIGLFLLALVFKIFTHPLSKKAYLYQQKMKLIQKEIAFVQKQHPKDLVKQAEALQKIYKKYKFNPYFNFLILLINLPIFLGLFNALKTIFEEFPSVNPKFLGLFHLDQPSILLVGLFLGWQVWYLWYHSKETKNKITTWTISFLMWLVLLPVFLKLPAIILVYFLFTLILGFLEEKFIFEKFYSNKTEEVEV